MLSGSRRIAVLLGLLTPALLAVLVCPALAQPSSAKQKTASELVKKAIARSEAGDHEAAIKLYNDAYDLAPNSLLLSNIGAQYQELGQWEDALEYFCRYLKEDPGGVNAAFARSQAKIVQRQLGRKWMNPCAPPPSSPGASSAAVAVKPAKSPPDVATRPARSPPDEAEPTEEERGPSTVKPTPPPPPVKSTGEEPAAKVTSTSGNPVLMYAGLAAGIAGIAAGGIGIYYGIQGKSISDEINSHPKDQPWQDDIRAKQTEGERDNRLQAAYLITSGVLVATGVVLYVIGRPDATEHPMDRTVHVAPTANGVVVFGRF
jgi:hypothetical protein